MSTRWLRTPDHRKGRIIFEGKAKCNDAEDDFVHTLERGEIKKGEKPSSSPARTRPGMPEMLKASPAIMSAGLGNVVALPTDGRFSSGSHRFLIGHIVPEAQEGALIGLARDGDKVIIDAEERVLDLPEEKEELAKRKRKVVPKLAKYTKGTLAKYAKAVSDASHGCITDGATMPRLGRGEKISNGVLRVEKFEHGLLSGRICISGQNWDFRSLKVFDRPSV
jgi:dihydroxy-acid dehydratase